MVLHKKNKQHYTKCKLRELRNIEQKMQGNSYEGYKNVSSNIYHHHKLKCEVYQYADFLCSAINSNY